MQTGSIHCNLKPTKEILDGDKATKSIKVHADYTYEISTSIDITFKNTALSKQKESPIEKKSNYCICESKEQYSNYLVVKEDHCDNNFDAYCMNEDQYKPNYCICKAISAEEFCSDGTKLGECSLQDLGIKCSRNINDGSPELVSDCITCGCPNNKLCYEVTNVCIDEVEQEQITTNICQCTIYGEPENNNCLEGYEPICQRTGYPDEYGVYRFNCFCRQVTAKPKPTVYDHGGF
jgi:hypothetical protein